ncbi:MAG: T9SS type A sorting domain-containing protein [Saprospiraceae bacterium]|nr:T9SS type A sorting domain-containing protein [Saprospiraceae bacterium]
MDLLYSVVDAEGDNGNGQVISKNQPVLSDSIWLGNYISATRHANGRDWWVVVPRRVKNGYHVCLFTPEGVEYKGMQTIGDTSYQFCCGQTAFSPDGSKYFKNWPDGLQILNFDRCSGAFSNPVYLDYDTGPNGAGGVAVSPSNQYLYLTAGDTVFQYDLWASDLAASRQVVAEYDGYVSPFPTGFFQAMLAPNGKIYFTAGSSNNVLHVIHNPDLPGLACNVEQHGVQLPALTDYLIPNFANYRLYDLPGSPCDTLGIDAPVTAVEAPAGAPAAVLVYPNPTSGLAEVTVPKDFAGILTVVDASGRKVHSTSIEQGKDTLILDLSRQHPGLYWISLSDENGRIATSSKLSIVH